MNILVVERTFPWPQSSGASIRAGNIVRALAQLGEIDFFLVAHGNTPAVTVVPEGEPVARMARAPRAPRERIERSLWSRQLEWLVTSRLPLAVAMRDYSGVRSAFVAWARPRYDLIWVGRAHAYVPLSGLIAPPVVVDLDDLEDRKIDAWLDIAPETASLVDNQRRFQRTAELRRWASGVFNTVNRRRWRALERRIARSVDAVVLSSGLDRGRLGVPNAMVIPNGYARPKRPVGCVEPRQPPTIVFVGALTYGPNTDAARFLVRDVLPRIQARLPGTRLRLVGHHDHRLSDLASVAGVTLTGWVPEMTPELAQADLVAVPVRFGSGTRVKIAEAFAHQIPVVSTTLGCEGLDVVPGTHLLVADEPDAFASRCVEALTDRSLRRAITQAAHEIYLSRYRSEIVSSEITKLASAVAGEAASSRRERMRSRKAVRHSAARDG